jgi:hypothetical protein
MTDSPASRKGSAPAGRPRKEAPRRTARGLLAVAASLPDVAAPALRKRGFAQARLVTDWPAIVGDMLARETLPQKLVFPRGAKGDGILHLRVASGFALEVQHLAPQIVDRINGFFGYRAVADLRYVQGPIPPLRRARKVAARRLPEPEEARLDRTTGAIEDPGLRSALKRLGRAVSTGRESPGRR